MKNNPNQKQQPEDIDPEDFYDDDDMDDDAEGEPDYYYCNSCGYSTVTNHGNWGCPRCTAIMEPEYF
jgi:rubrerythrin